MATAVAEAPQWAAAATATAVAVAVERATDAARRWAEAARATVAVAGLVGQSHAGRSRRNRCQGSMRCIPLHAPHHRNPCPTHRCSCCCIGW